MPQDVFADNHLGPVFARPVARLLMIDPYALHGSRQRATLVNFLARLKPAPGCKVLIKAGVTEERTFDYPTARAQTDEARRLEQQFAKLGLRLLLASAKMVEHDRILLVEGRDGDWVGCYRVLLGHGLAGFEYTSQRYSEGVWFEMSPDEFARDWAYLTR